jgi:hypothetical protein
VKARAKLMDQARKALYCLYWKLRNISIPIDLQFKLFDTLILPILTYGSEIWGYENTKQLEKLHQFPMMTILFKYSQRRLTHF